MGPLNGHLCILVLDNLDNPARFPEHIVVFERSDNLDKAHLYIPVLEHLGIVLFEPFGSFETVLEVALVGNFVLELVDSFVWEPIER